MGRAAIQSELPFRQHGGRRIGAGRKRAPGAKRRVAHKRRPVLDERVPQHIVLRTIEGLPSMRTSKTVAAIRAAIAAAERADFRVPHWSVQGNHLHLIAEADNREALSRGMQGLGVRLARTVNRVWQRKGTVFADHYYSRPLASPTEVRNALKYVLDNHAVHVNLVGEAQRLPLIDPFSSLGARSSPVPATWLLREGWLRVKRPPHLPRTLRAALWERHSLEAPSR